MKAILFDCDGVLINSETLADRAQEGVLARYGLSYTAREFMEDFSGLSRDDRFARFSRDSERLYGVPLPAAARDELELSYEYMMATRLAATAGMAALLARLKAAGVPCAVASNSGQDRLEEKLRQVGLYEILAPHIYGVDHVPSPKPAPDLYHYAAARLGVGAADCVIVEDSLVGLRAGLAAGGHAIGFSANCTDPALGAALLAATGARETAQSMTALADRVAALLDLPPEMPPPSRIPAGPSPRPPQP